ncbi:MAG: hypothetical protein J6Q52_06405 [Clostridia bacterium]|nr:hypothetical protein [Clostridia bacterium]
MKKVSKLIVAILALSMIGVAPMVAVADTPKAEYVSYNRDLSGDWEGNYGSLGYILYGDDNDEGEVTDAYHFMYTKNIFTGVAEGTRVDFTTANGTVHAKGLFSFPNNETYSGALVSYLQDGAPTWRTYELVGDTAGANMPKYPAALGETGRMPGQKTGNGGHGTNISFTLTEDAVKNGGIYMTFYTAFISGASQESVNYHSAIYDVAGEVDKYCSNYYYQPSNANKTKVADSVVRAYNNKGLYVTYKFNEAGDYIFVMWNELKVTGMGVNAIYFDTTAPTSVSPVETISPESMPSAGEGTAEYVQTDKYTGSNWEGVYGKDGYLIPSASDADSFYGSHLTNPIYTAGLYNDGNPATIYGGVLDVTAGGGFTYAEYPSTYSGALAERLGISGSLFRKTDSSQTGTQAVKNIVKNMSLRIPGSEERTNVEMGSSQGTVGIGTPYLYSFALTTDEEVYVSVYVYANTYRQQDASVEMTLGVMKGRYISFRETAKILTGYNSGTITPHPDRDNIVISDEVTINDYNKQGRWVTFKIDGGAGFYTIFGVEGETVLKNSNGIAGIFFDKEKPIYNVPKYVIKNSTLTEIEDGEEVSVIDEFYGKAGSITPDGKVNATFVENYTLDTNKVSVNMIDGKERFVSILVSGDTSLDFYRGVIADFDDITVQKTLTYQITASGDVMYTFKMTDAFSIVSSLSDIKGIYFDETMPTTYRFTEVALNKSASPDWEDTYGSEGYVIPYGKDNGAGVLALDYYVKGESFSFDSKSNVKIEDLAWETPYISNSIYAPNTTEHIGGRFTNDGAGIYAFEFEDEEERYVTLNLYQYWKDAWVFDADGSDNPKFDIRYKVEIYAGSNILAISSATPVTTYEVGGNGTYGVYSTFKAKGSFAVKVTMALDSNNQPIGNQFCLGGIFFDKVSDGALPIPTEHSIKIATTDGVRVVGRTSVADGEDAVLYLYDRPLVGKTVDTVTVDGVSMSVVDGVLTIPNVTSTKNVVIQDKYVDAVAPEVELALGLYDNGINTTAMLVTYTAGNVSTTTTEYGIVYNGYRFKFTGNISDDNQFVMYFKEGMLEVNDEILVKAYATYIDKTTNQTTTIYSQETPYVVRDVATILPEGLEYSMTEIASSTSDTLDMDLTFEASVGDISYNSFKLNFETNLPGAVVKYRVGPVGAFANATSGMTISNNIKPTTNYVVYVQLYKGTTLIDTKQINVTTIATNYDIDFTLTAGDITSSEARVVISGISGANGNVKYYYRLQGEEWVDWGDTTFSFDGLNASTSYVAEVKVVDVYGVEKVKTLSITTLANTAGGDTPDVPGGDTPDAPGGDTPDAPAESTGCGGAIAMLSAFMGLIALAVVGKKY